MSSRSGGDGSSVFTNEEQRLENLRHDIQTVTMSPNYQSNKHINLYEIEVNL